MKTNWYVGQQVYCLQNGDGVIMDTKNDAPYPISVKFNGCESTYTELGKLFVNNETPMLYPAKPEIIVPKWQPKEGEWCWFWDIDSDSAVLSKFLRITEGNNYRSESGTVWQHCALFVGELPPHLKEVEK
jgi:hypothetical protein